MGFADGIEARQGCTVIVPYREEMAKRHLKVTGDLGRVIFMVRNHPSRLRRTPDSNEYAL